MYALFYFVTFLLSFNLGSVYMHPLLVDAREQPQVSFVFLNKFFWLFYFICLPACLYVCYVYTATSDLVKASDPPELDLQMAVC